MTTSIKEEPRRVEPNGADKTDDTLCRTRGRTSSGNPMLDAALDFASHAIPVFPCVPGDKRPLTEHGFHEATCDETKIRSWWKEHPLANIAVPTGAVSKLIVVDLDVDPAKGKNGPAEWSKLLDAHGAVQIFRRHRTPRGGEHLLFEHPGKGRKIPNSTDKLAIGIDVRGDGGYIVVPPSRSAAGAYKVTKEGTPGPLPKWLLELLAPKEKPAPSPRSTGTTAEYIPAADDAKDLAAALQSIPSDNYDDWVRVGMALHSVDSNGGLNLWEEWSKGSGKYAEGDCSKKWKSFHGSNVGGSAVTVATIFGMARERGWKPAPQEDDLAVRLAKLDPIQYDKVREDEAKKMGCRVGTLDVMVEAQRKKILADANPAGCVIPPDPEPWGEPVNGAQLLDEIAETYRRFVILPDHGAAILALWTVHTYCYDKATYSPIIALISPVKRCGKSVTLETAKALVRAPLYTTNVAQAALYRAIEKFRPTTLIDEFDSLGDDAQEDMRNVLNAGHHRSGVVIRCVGDNHDVGTFAVYCPKMVGSIKDLPDTIMDRSIVLRMRRKTKRERTERLRKFDATDIKRRIIRWVADNGSAIESAVIEPPEQLSDRAADGWEALLAIAQAAGGQWLDLAVAAAIGTSGSESSEPIGVELLKDILAVFQQGNTDRLSTSTLLEALNAMEDRPWPRFCKGKSLNAHHLARLLAPFEVAPGSVRIGDATPKGYALDWFDDAAKRYLPPENEFSKRNTATTLDNIGDCPLFTSATEPTCGVSENATKPNNDGHCGGVAFPKPENEGEDKEEAI